MLWPPQTGPWPVPIIAQGASEAPRSAVEQARKQGPEAPPAVEDDPAVTEWLAERDWAGQRPHTRTRLDKGTRVPEAAKPAPPAPRLRSDEDLVRELIGLMEAGEIEDWDAEGPSVRAVQDALKIRFERAKRIRALSIPWRRAALAAEAAADLATADLGEHPRRVNGSVS